MKKISVVIIFCLIISTIVVNAETFGESESVQKQQIYQVEDVLKAVAEVQDKGTATNEELVADVFEQQSMGIAIPNIDTSKIAKNVLIKDLDSVFIDSLKEHNVEIKNFNTMTLSDYEAIERTWPLTKSDIEIANRLYPELADQDISGWTYGDYKDYYTKKDSENLVQRFSETQIIELEKRGITLKDTFYLFKEFHTAESILDQTDEKLKAVLTGYYESKISMLSIESLLDLDLSKYTSVNFPRYGTDYFLNDVLTSTYWMNIQADRALKTQKVLYNSTSSTLTCTNMYGTYSYSQGGAHEGIDFALGYEGSSIYAVFDGIVRYDSTYHQLSVYDVNSPDEPKTYTYLHMMSIAVSTNDDIEAYDYVGQQGEEGNATGPHVHFEVHSGDTTSLSPENDDVLGSISPYRLVDYIGEL